MLRRSSSSSRSRYSTAVWPDICPPPSWRSASAPSRLAPRTRALVVLELHGILTGLAAAEDQPAAALRTAVEALAGPLARLAEMDEGIRTAERKCAAWSERLADTNPDKRAEARAHFAEWSAEVDRLRAERDDVERGYRPLFEDRERRRKELRIMQGG